MQDSIKLYFFVQSRADLGLHLDISWLSNVARLRSSHFGLTGRNKERARRLRFSYKPRAVFRQSQDRT